jgi:phospholipase C
LTVEFHDVRISNVFVLMLENHSFDNIFAFSGINGIQAATTSDSNNYGGNTYNVSHPAPTSMPTDPGHEFLDTVEQLAGEGYNKKWQSGQQYPPINNEGYVANYATTDTEIVQPGAPRKPVQTEYGDVMLCFDTKRQLPVIYTLATEFAICDQWFSSIPGPTWPNRFFVHGASSVNWDDGPTTDQIKVWNFPTTGFVYPNGSIYDALGRNHIQYRLYSDKNGPFFGGYFPQVAALKGISALDIWDFADFRDHLQHPYPYPYTFIEPNYGDVEGGSYKGGSSQHPMDGMARGEALIKATYEALRASPLWATSLLIITYDEHGGFYDSAKPQHTATPPGDGGSVPANQHGFKFDQYGVRVPAVVVSPLIAKGAVDHTLYDHSSVPATLEQLWELPSLTNRDKHANDVLHLLTLSSPRTDCPTTLPNPVADVPLAAPTDGSPAREGADAVADRPLPDSGNVVGFLGIALKTDIELSDASEAEAEAKRQRVLAITTGAEAEAYAAEVAAKIKAARAAASPPAVAMP